MLPEQATRSRTIPIATIPAFFFMDSSLTWFAEDRIAHVTMILGSFFNWLRAKKLMRVGKTFSTASHSIKPTALNDLTGYQSDLFWRLSLSAVSVSFTATAL
jgi:hypothetical protein